MGKEKFTEQIEITPEEQKLLDDLKLMRERGPRHVIIEPLINYFSGKPTFVQTSTGIIKIPSCSLFAYGFKRKLINLDLKVASFIFWYERQNMPFGSCNSIEVRKLIEKMAIWYELRCPNGKLNNLDKSAINEYYNFEGFFVTLSQKEKQLLRKVIYKQLIYINLSTHLHLSQDGFVIGAEGIEGYANHKISNEELKGKHISEVVLLFKERGIVLPNGNELESEFIRTELLKEIREELLECVMYRIIELGGKIAGPRRALLFAQEFGTDIDIPMMYGVDSSDEELKDFITTYINAGGDDDLECYVDYLSRIHRFQRVNTITIRSLLTKLNENGFQKIKD